MSRKRPRAQQSGHALLREIDQVGRQFGQTLAELAALGEEQGHEVARPRFANVKADGMRLLGLFDQLQRRGIQLTPAQFRGAVAWRDRATTLVELADAVLAENPREYNRVLTRLRNDTVLGY